MDELRAAILAAKLPYLDQWNAVRRQIAARYRAQLSGAQGLQVPAEPPAQERSSHVYHLYVVRVDDREDLRTYLREHGIGTDVH